jgi:protein phosphatase
VQAIDLEEANDLNDLTRLAPKPPKKTSGELPRLGVDDFSDEESDDGSSPDSEAITLFEGESQIGVDEPTGPFDLILLESAGESDRGAHRRRNEDAFLIDEAQHFYMVADGMGGAAGGEVASNLAVKEVANALRATESFVAGDRTRRGSQLVSALERANDAIYAAAKKNPEYTGMGTTVLAARFSPGKQRVYIAHVGDSRCYRLRNGVLRLMTTDHTLAARGVTGPLASNIRRALGVARRVKVDLVVDTPLPDDVYLLCSDGLTKMLNDEKIQRIVTREPMLDRAVSELIQAANLAGGRDNVTVVLVSVREITVSKRGGGAKRSPSRWKN